MSNRKPNWTDREKMILMEEYEKRKDVLRAKISSTITSSTKNTAWDEITEAMNSQNPSVKRNMKYFLKEWDNICSSAKTKFSHKKRMQEKTGNYFDNYIYHVNTSSYAF